MDPLRLTPEIDLDVARYLELERAASHPYADFVYGTPELHVAIHGYLFGTGSCEFCPPEGRLAVVGEAPIGMMAALSGKQLRRRRMQAAYWLARSDFVAADPDLPRRVQLAAEALARPDDEDVYLSRLAVVPHARGRGLADAMLEQLFQEAREAGAPRCVLEVAPTNAAAVALYRRRGFVECHSRSVLDPRTGRALAYLHMVRDLGVDGGGR